LSSRRSSLAGRRAVSSSRTRGDVARPRARAFRVSAYEQADTDGEAVKVDIPMADVSRGKKIGSGSFGDVFEGTWKGQRVILKERKMTGPGKKYFDAEAALNRRLKSAKGVAPFLGVAGANAFLVWKDEGRNTLDAVLGGGSGGGLSLFGGGGGGGGIAAAMGVGDESRAVRLFAKQLLQAVKSVHDAGVVHRDVKPDNILFAQSGSKLTGSKPVIKLIDLGGACDLRTGVNYSKDETVFDPVYGPPEKYLDVSGVGSLFGSSLGWAKAKPDLFDAFSCGMVILQVACPSLRKGKPGSTKRDLDIYAFDAQAWRDSLPERRQADFAILDENGGQGWDLVCGLLAQRKKRTSVAQAIGHPFCR
jgi:serine/threonine protein kinase